MTDIDLTRVANYMLAQQQVTDMVEALEALLPPYEQQEIAHRLQIFELLAEGVPQREVAKQVGVGVATVTRGSKALQAGKFHPEILGFGNIHE